MTTNQRPLSLCIFRLSAIGDVSHLIPVVKTLQARYPDIKITWVIGRLEHRLLSGLAGVEFIVFDKNNMWSSIKELRQAVKGRSFDVLLQMQLSFRANWVSRLIPAKRRLGYDKARSKELHSLVINERIAPLPNYHVLDGFMQFAYHLGCDTAVYDWSLAISETDRQWAQQQIGNKPITILISPCSSHVLRNWSVTNYAALIDRIASLYNAQIILTASPAAKEKAFVAEIAAKVHVDVTNLAGEDTLKQLWALMSVVDLVISPDSGPLHMAGATGTPVIGLMAASNPQRSGSYQFPHLTVNKYPEACQQFLHKSVNELKWGTKTEFPGAMDLITVDEVLAKVKIALSKGKV